MDDKEKLINYLHTTHMSTELIEAILQWYTEVAVPNGYALSLIINYKFKDLFTNCKTEQEQLASIRKAVINKSATFKAVTASDIIHYTETEAVEEDEPEEEFGEVMGPSMYVPYTQFIRRIIIPTDEVLVDLYGNDREILYQCLYYGLSLRKKITERLKALLSEVEYDALKNAFCAWRDNYDGIDIDVFNPPKALSDDRTSELKPSPPENTVQWFQYHYDGYVDYGEIKSIRAKKDIF